MGADLLAQFQDISRGSVPRFDFHLHSTWVDGKDTTSSMHSAAVERGLRCVLFSEHARKTSGDWFGRFADEIRALPSESCRALVGVETKVEDFSGALDTTEAIVSKCDLVMASVHRFPGEKGVVRGFADVDPDEAVETEFKLAMAVLDNPWVDILGHPFGMSYRRFSRRPDEARFRKLIEKAALKGVAVEINGHYHPDPWTLIGWCREAGARVSLGSNAHETASVGQVIRILEGSEPSWNPSEF